jgi:hypothetical protein
LREPVADLVPAEVPHDRMGELGLNLTGTAIDRKQCFEQEPGVGGVVARSAAAGSVRVRDERGQLVDGPVVQDRLNPLERGDGPVAATHRSLRSRSWSSPIR